MSVLPFSPQLPRQRSPSDLVRDELQIMINDLQILAGENAVVFRLVCRFAHDQAVKSRKKLITQAATERQERERQQS